MSSQRVVNLAFAMETDYDLPVPTHRPFITLEARYDAPLPFRRELKQVTELTAENSTPYMLPRKYEPSQFELLPYIVRERVYMYLGVSSKEELDVPVDDPGECDDSPDYFFFSTHRTRMKSPVVPSRKYFEPSILYLNRSTRAETLDILFRKVDVRFAHHLSNGKIFWSNAIRYHGFEVLKADGSSNTVDFYVSVRTRLERMRLAPSTFNFMRRIRLDYRSWPLENRWADTRPHPLRVCHQQVGRQTVKQAASIRFIAKHCPRLVSLHLDSGSLYYADHYWNKSKKIARWFAPLIFAFRELTQSCYDLETVGHTRPFRQESGELVEADSNLDLTNTPIALRDSLIEEWCRTVVREMSEKL